MTLYRLAVKSLNMVREFDTQAHAEKWADGNIPFEYNPMVEPFESNGFYMVCAWCGLILYKIEEEEDVCAMKKMSIRFSHGICKDCRRGVSI